MRSARVLLAAHATVGHTMALRAVAQVLKARGTDTRFAIAALTPPSVIVNRLPHVLQAALRLPGEIARDATPVWARAPSG